MEEEAAEGDRLHCQTAGLALLPTCPVQSDRYLWAVVLLLVCLHVIKPKDRPPIDGLADTLGLGFSLLFFWRKRTGQWN